MERNGIFGNKPEYTGTTQNDAGMKGNGLEWNRNVPERAGMTPKYTEMSRNETRMNVLAFRFFFLFSMGAGETFHVLSVNNFVSL